MTDLFALPEGATLLDPDETEGLRFKHVATRGELDQLEQANVTAGLQWLSKQPHPDVLSVGFACELHKRLFGAVWRWAGRFRATEKNIGVAPWLVAMRLKQLFDDAAHWVAHDTYPARELAARFHHKLVYIHPFPNGNGRHARIMTDALLTKGIGAAPIDWSGGFALTQMNQRRDDYIAALRAADAHDFSLLLRFVGA